MSAINNPEHKDYYNIKQIDDLVKTIRSEITDAQMRCDLLWQNTTVQTFDPQDVAVEFDGYKMLSVRFGVIGTSYGDSCTIVFPAIVGYYSSAVITYSDGYIRYRKVGITSKNVVHFYDGYYLSAIGTMTLNNQNAVPIEIYGIK